MLPAPPRRAGAHSKNMVRPLTRPEKACRIQVQQPRGPCPRVERSFRDLCWYSKSGRNYIGCKIRYHSAARINVQYKERMMRKSWNHLSGLGPGFRYMHNPYYDEGLSRHCTECGTVFPDGTTHCPECNTLVPYNEKDRKQIKNFRLADCIIAIVTSLVVLGIVVFVATR